MIVKLTKSFVPFLALLLLLMGGTIYLDQKALENSKVPLRIDVNELSVESTLELTEQIDLTSESILKKDSLYLEATKWYKKRKYTKSKSLFLDLMNLHQDESILYKYMGLIAYKEGKYSEAENFFRKSIQLNPVDPSAYSNLGIIHSKLGKNTKAAHNYQKAILLAPNNMNSFLNYGILLNKRRDYKEAIPFLDSVITRSNGKLKSKAYYYKGVALSELNQVDEARSMLDKSIEYQPKYVLPRIQLAILEKDTDEKERQLKLVLLLNDKNGAANYYLAKFYQDQGNNVLAESYALKAIRFSPDNEEYISFMGDFYIAQNRMNDAQKLFGELHHGDTLNSSYYFYKGKIDYKKGLYTEALINYNLAIEKSDSSSAEAFLNRGNVLNKLGDENGAIDSYKNAFELKSSYSEAYYNLAKVYAKKGEDSLAILYYNRTLDLKPDYEKAWFNKGILYKNAENWTEAKVCFEKAVFYDNTYLKARVNLGVVFNKMNQSDLAVKAYKDLLSLYPNYVKGWYNLGLTHKWEKQYAEARVAFVEALKLDQNHKLTREALYNLYGKMNDSQSELIVLKSYVEDFPEEVQSRYDLAEIYKTQNKVKSAASQYHKIIRFDPYSEEAYKELSTIYIDAGDRKKELALEEKYLKYFPDDEKVYDLARSYQKRRDYIKAIKLYEQSIKLGRDDDWVHYWKGKAHHDAGQIQEAGEEYILALKQDDTHKYALLKMGDLTAQNGVDSKAIKYYKRVLKLYPDFASSKNISEKLKALGYEVQ